MNKKDEAKSKLSLLFVGETILSIFLALLSLYIFTKLSYEVFRKETFAYDSLVTNFVYSFRSPEMTKLALFITDLGSGSFLLSASALFVSFFIYKKKRRYALTFSLMIAIGAILNRVLKNIIERPRPDLFPLVHENQFSFPSGHAMNSFVFYSTITYFVYRITKSIKLTVISGIISGILILLIGLSRIYLGAHYPSDVLGGFIAGLCWLTTVIVFEKSLVFRNLYKKSAE
jgi:membrane-associated phospholipid phosphatase